VSAKKERVKTCDHCGIVVDKPPSQLHGERVHCSRECLRSANRVVVRCPWCGQARTVPKSMGTDHNVFCTREHYDAWQSVHLRGSRVANWKGGMHREDLLWYWRVEGREWRQRVKEQHDFRCGLCGERHESNDRRLTVHHRIPWMDRPDLRSADWNGIAVCRKCPDGRGHYWLHSNSGKAMREALETEALCVDAWLQEKAA
jgi:hypothetical protein